MTKVVLPRLNQTGVNEWADVQTNDEALQTVINGEIANENLSGAAGITRANLAAESKPVTWYTPKVIATEESRTNIAFGTLTTADEITNVVVPSNGLLFINYLALVKSSGSSTGRLAIFIGVNQFKNIAATVPVVVEASTFETGFTTMASHPTGITPLNAGTSFVTTGMNIATGGGGTCVATVAPGTYNISIQFRATSGSITAKERSLWIYTIGF